MSLILIESCDLQNRAVGAKWSALTADSAHGQFQQGLTCWLCGNRGDADAIQKIVNAGDEDDVFWAGFRWLTNSPGADSGDTTQGDTFAFFEGATLQHISMNQRANGSLQVKRGNGAGEVEIGRTTTNVITPNVWVYVEVGVKVHDTTGWVEIWLDGTQVLDLTALDTRFGGATGLIDKIGWNSHRNIVTYFRDVYILNEQGAAPFNTRLGPVRIKPYLPDGVGNYAQFTPSAGANWQNVDETPAPDGDTTFNDSQSAAQRDSFAMADAGAEMDAILGVQAFTYGRFNGTALDIGTFLRRSATDDDGGVETPSSAYTTRGLTIWQTDPVAAAAWTRANFNATEFGYRSA